ncbi:MAG: hypothetical protein JWM11_6066 [Planctomycetaceae bacterium]|nr:hypothetical protein [Planctomycetaceae bacterium]
MAPSTSFFAPFSPGPTKPFDRKWAAHLLRRTGFGANPAAIDSAVQLGLEDTVEQLFRDLPEEQSQYDQLFETLNCQFANFTDTGTSQAWWLHRMLTTANPFREKLTLFWHGHFATSINKVEDTQLMLRQIGLLRQHAWGDFRTLIHAVAKDAAMIVWLDNESNTKEHPNENFAREVMELFTCGIGNYTEKDVRAAARAFSGWHRDGINFAFNAEVHDTDVKQFLGKRGRFDGGDILDILLAQPATPKFIATKLLKFFATPDPAPEVIAEATDVLNRGHLNIKWFLRELFLSDYFLSDACYRKQVASPIEFLVGTLRTWKVRKPTAEHLDSLSAMGQELLAPPNVKGWDGGRKWINSSTLAGRVEFAEDIANLNAGDNPWSPHLPLEELVPAELNTPQTVVGRLVEIVFQGEIPGATRKEFEEFIVQNEEGPQLETFRDDLGFRQDRTRQLLAIMWGLPEYQAI